MSKTELPYRVAKSSAFEADNRSWLVEQNLEVLRDTFDNYVANLSTKKQSSGTVTIPNGGTAITVTHGLNISGTYAVVVTNSANQSPGVVWVTKTANDFTVHTSVAAGAPGWNFEWILREA